MARANAYEKLTKKGKKMDFKSLTKQEDTYWVGAGAVVLVMPFVSIIDGGFSLAVAYGARKLYQKHNGK